MRPFVLALTRLVASVVAVSTTACASSFRSSPSGLPESLYARALTNLDSANVSTFLDSAVSNLDGYLALKGKLEHRREAAALLRLARNSQRLNRVEGALQQARTTASADEKVKEGDATDALKEIQRLKDELAKANDELDRIKKRLAAPKPSP